MRTALQEHVIELAATTSPKHINRFTAAIDAAAGDVANVSRAVGKACRECSVGEFPYPNLTEEADQRAWLDGFASGEAPLRPEQAMPAPPKPRRKRKAKA